MDDEFAYQVSETDSAVVVAARGDVDLATCDRLIDVVTGRLHPGTRVVVECSGITFLDSMGLRAFLDLRSLAASRGAVFALAGVSEPVWQILRLTGTEDHFVVLDDPADVAGAASGGVRVRPWSGGFG